MGNNDSRESAPMSREEVVETLKTMVFGVQAFKRFNAKEREALDKAWNIIQQEIKSLLKMRDICKEHHSCYDNCPFHVDNECVLTIPPANWSDENLYLISKALKGDKETGFHCGVEESGGHAYNCNDCPNKCDEWYQWDKEMKAK